MEQIQLFFKDPAKVARAATICFFILVALATYFLFTLSRDLVYNTGVYAKLFASVGLAIAFCFVIIFFGQRAKQETIVYLDKKIENTTGQQAFTSGQSQDLLNLNSLREKIKSGGKEERWQHGLNELCGQLNGGQGALYIANKKGENKSLDMRSGYAIVLADGEENPSFNWGEGLVGQVATSGKSLYLDELPEGYASRIESGLGSALPKFLFIMAIKKENETVGVVEVATFTDLSEALRRQAEEAAIILSEIL